MRKISGKYPTRKWTRNRERRCNFGSAHEGRAFHLCEEIVAATSDDTSLDEFSHWSWGGENHASVDLRRISLRPRDQRLIHEQTQVASDLGRGHRLGDLLLQSHRPSISPVFCSH